MTAPEFLTIAQTAELLQVSKPTVRDMIATGRIRPEFVIEVTRTDKRISRRAFESAAPTPIRQPVTPDEISLIVRKELHRFFVLERSA